MYLNVRYICAGATTFHCLTNVTHDHLPQIALTGMGCLKYHITFPLGLASCNLFSTLLCFSVVLWRQNVRLGALEYIYRLF